MMTEKEIHEWIEGMEFNESFLQDLNLTLIDEQLDEEKMKRIKARTLKKIQPCVKETSLLKKIVGY